MANSIFIDCQICQKRILTHSGHMHKIGEACKYECPDCPTLYTRWYDVKKHIVKYHYHNGYKCQNCGRFFDTEKSLTNSDHADLCFRASELTLSNREAGLKRFVCLLCGTVSLTMRGLSLHISRKHKNMQRHTVPTQELELQKTAVAIPVELEKMLETTKCSKKPSETLKCRVDDKGNDSVDVVPWGTGFPQWPFSPNAMLREIIAERRDTRTPSPFLDFCSLKTP